MKSPVQTNEVGRSRALALGFLSLASETGLPLRLLELGSSAGLNLRWDAFSLLAPAGSSSAIPDSPVQFTDYADGALPSLPGHVRIAERAGCDEAPVSCSTTTVASPCAPTSGRTSWTACACSTARSRWPPSIPVSVERSGAADWLERRLAEPAAGACTVVFHSIVMQYVDAGERERIGALIDRGGRARHARTRRWPGSRSSRAASSRSCA